jgi:hypothetical protein
MTELSELAFDPEGNVIPRCDCDPEPRGRIAGRFAVLDTGHDLELDEVGIVKLAGRRLMECHQVAVGVLEG